MSMRVNRGFLEVAFLWFSEEFVRRVRREVTDRKGILEREMPNGGLHRLFELVIPGGGTFSVFSSALSMTPEEMLEILQNLVMDASASVTEGYAWERRDSAKKVGRYVMVVARNIPRSISAVIKSPREEITEAVLQWCFEQFLQKVRDASSNMPDKEAHTERLTAALELDGPRRSESRIFVRDLPRPEELLFALRNNPTDIGGWYGDTMREKVFAIHPGQRNGTYAVVTARMMYSRPVMSLKPKQW